ncbi:MAG: PAS domain S-box protein [Nitrospiria bacterium]
MKSRFSLKVCIPFVIIVLGICLISLVLWTTLSFSLKNSRKQQALNDEITMSLFFDLSRTSLLVEDYAEVQTQSERLALHPHIQQVIVTDVQSRVVASNASGLVGTTFPIKNVLENSQWKSLEISNQAGHLGFIAIEFSDLPIRKAVDNVRALGIFIGGAGIIAATFIGITFGSLLTRRLKKLVRGAEQISGGNWHARTQLTGMDEVAKVSRAFDLMADHIERNLKVLQESSEKYRAIFEQSTDSIFLVDPEDGQIVVFNENAYKRLGYTREEFSLLKISDFNSEKSDAKLRERIDTVLRDGKGTFEKKFVTKRGSHRDVRIKSVRINIQGKPFVLSVVEDITEKKKSEEFQRLSTTVFENTSEAILVTDADEKIISVNSAFSQISGYSYEEVLGKTPRLFQSGKHDEAFYREMWDDLSANGQWKGEIWDKKKNGKIYPKWLSIKAVKDGTGKTVQYIGIFDDITELKKLEKQVFQTQKLETIGQLAGGVAHEFNNLLTPIIGYADILIAKTLKQPKMQDPLLIVRKAALRAAGLTKELLSFSRQNPIILKSQSLSGLTLEVNNLLRQAIDRKIEISVETSDNLWPVLIDADQVHQVIVNLCVNARDALEECMLENKNFEPLIQIKLKNVYLDHAYCESHPEAKIGDFVCLSVADNGSGIDEAAIPHLFEPFFTTKEVGRGTGLGLASTHGIVKRHKGWIDLKTAKGKGTTFEVYFPRSGRPVAAAVQEVMDLPTPNSSETIMIVDDDELIRELGKAALERHGHRVLLAEGGEQALKIFKEENGRIKVVILDLSMPYESGWDVLQRLRAFDPDLKAVISSGRDISSQDSKTKKSNLKPYTILSKPFSPSDMERAIREVLS